jgi:hypothetical protein
MIRIGRRALLVCLLAALAAPLPAAAQLRRIAPDDVELADVIEIQLFGRDLHAYDGTGSGRTLIRLELGEVVRFQHAKGRIGLVLTNRRALAVSPGSGGWRQARYRVTETVQDSGLMGDRVALVLTGQRALGFNSARGSWFEESLGPGESIETTSIGAGTAVIVTDRRSIGMSPSSGAFVDVDMRVHEKLEGVSARSGVATVTTSQRVLVFQGSNARWVVQDRRINE